MKKQTKRSYSSEMRDAQAAQTKSEILKAAKKLFQRDGFDDVTISQLAKSADVSMPTIYAIFKSKQGVLQALIDSALPNEKFSELVDASMQEVSPEKRLKITAHLARQIYDAERGLMDILRGASIVSVELKQLEQEREIRRYERQGDYVKKMMKDGALAKELTFEKARDILWSLTGRDLYRMLVIERKWSSDEYEKWLARLLIQSFLGS